MMVKESGGSIKSTYNSDLNIITIAKGILISYVITIAIFVVFAYILSNTSYPEKNISHVVTIATIISILIAGSSVTKGIKNKGWLKGAIVGFIYMLVLYLVSSVVFKDFTVDRQVITITLLGVVAGSVGGIIGINLKKGSGFKK